MHCNCGDILQQKQRIINVHSLALYGAVKVETFVVGGGGGGSPEM